MGLNDEIWETFEGRRRKNESRRGWGSATHGIVGIP